MMTIIKCKNCGKSDVPFGETSVDITLKQSKFCDHCYKTDTEKQSYFFCSEGCFLEYMKKVLDGTEVLTWQ
jgi:hypothetical protein